MEQKYLFSGTYKRQGNKLISKHTCLLIAERQPTPTKPKYFIVDKSTQKGIYISSLFPKTENKTDTGNVYWFDYNGTKYELVLKDIEAEINLTS